MGEWTLTMDAGSIVGLGLGLLPWIALGFFMAFGIREPRPLPEAGDWSPDVPSPDVDEAEPGPLVSIVVPARNEEGNIVRCLASLARLEGVPYEVIVVDDRSDDRTAEVARGVEAGNAMELRVLEGGPLPEGWFGKPWACRQGAAVARGGLLLFTDADTVHHPTLLIRSLRAMEEDGAEVLSLLGRQEVETFGEKLVQPQVFTLIGIRFRSLDRVVPPEGWKEAIANGQFVLVARTAYETIGGHEAVRGEVVEDLRLAQELTRAGSRLSVRQGEDVFSTRMYTSLGQLVDGWTKNVAVGARQASGRWAGLALPGILLFLAFFWLLPAGAVAVAGVGVLATLGVLPSALSVGAGGAFGIWAALSWAMSVAIWAGAYRRFGVSPVMSLIYPLGTVVLALIVGRSWMRGERKIEWKGRTYGQGTESGDRPETLEAR
jgi:chlorobactene glucosyltransferase